jgi:gliding motility-associated-like protein
MLRVTNRTGQTDSDTITVKVDPSPIAGIASSGQPQRDGSMIVDGSISVGTGLSYNWSTTEGKIIGPTNQPAAALLGAGMYTLEVSDVHGCKSVKSFRFPIELYQIMSKPDYARTSWAQDTTIAVLANDYSTAGLIPGSVQVIKQPSRGEIRVNPDGTITYIPTGRISGSDEFTYVVHDIVGLKDSALVTIDIYDPSLKIPEAISPNGDGLNDRLIFDGLAVYPNSHLVIFTRSGQKVYESYNYQNDWDGNYLVKGSSISNLLPTGTYYYILTLGGTNRTIKGFVYISY